MPYNPHTEAHCDRDGAATARASWQRDARLPMGLGCGEVCAAPPAIRPCPRVLRGSLRRVAHMREKTVHAGIYYGWLIVATTFWMAIFTGGGRTGFGVFVLPMSAELSWSRGTISLPCALAQLIRGVSQPFVGRLYDRVGGRGLILVCLLVSGLGTALLALTTNLVFFILVFAV